MTGELPPLTVNIQHTVDDWVETAEMGSGRRLHPVVRWAARVGWTVLLALAFWETARTGAGIYSLILAGVATISMLRATSVLRRIYEKDIEEGRMGLPTTVEVAPDGLWFRDADGHMVYRWRRLEHWFESERIIAVLGNPGPAVIPKRYLGAEQLVLLRRHLTGRLGPAKMSLGG